MPVYGNRCGNWRAKVTGLTGARWPKSTCEWGTLYQTTSKRECIHYTGVSNVKLKSSWNRYANILFLSYQHNICGDFIALKLARTTNLLRLRNCLEISYVTTAYFAYCWSFIKYNHCYSKTGQKYNKFLVFQKKTVRIAISKKLLDIVSLLSFSRILTVVNLYLFYLITEDFE